MSLDIILRRPWRAVAIGPATAILLAASLGGCAGALQRATSRRPAVLVTADGGERQVAALTDIDNTGVCSVQLVARDPAGEIVATSAWLPPRARLERFEVHAGFRWIVLEVDPGCGYTFGVIHYATITTAAEVADAGGAAPAR